MSANLPVTCTSTLAISTAPGSAVSPAPHALSPSLPVASQTHVISSGKANLPDTIKQAEQQIALYGPGPHTPQQKEELSKLNTVLFKCREIQKGKAVASSESSFSSVMLAGSAGSSGSKPPGVPQTGGSDIRVLDKRRLQELVKEVDPLEQLDDDVEEVLLQIADDFIESVVTNACSLAKHRKSSTLEAKDVQLHLERNWNMWIPGFGAEELRPYKKAFHTEAHKQRMALIKKTLKKY